MILRNRGKISNTVTIAIVMILSTRDFYHWWRSQAIQFLITSKFQGDKAEQQEKIFDLLEKEREKRQKLRRSKQEAGILKSKTSKADKKSKKTVRGDHFKKKFRKTFEILFDEEEQRLKRNLKDENEKVISYQT